MVDTCLVTGTIVAPDGTPLRRTFMLFQRLPEEAFVADDATGLPTPVTKRTEDDGSIEVELIPGAYLVKQWYSRHDYFRIDVPDEPTARLEDIQDDILQPPPSRIIEAVGEAKEARDVAVGAKGAAEEAAARAEAARAAARTIFPDIAAGIAATTDGDYFSVPSEDGDEYLILYRNDSGSATEVERYPSAAGVTSIVKRSRWQLSDGNISLSTAAGSEFLIGWAGLRVLMGLGAPQDIEDRAVATLAYNTALYIDMTQGTASAYVVSEDPLSSSLQQSFVDGTNFLLIMNRYGQLFGPLAEMGRLRKEATVREQQVTDLAQEITAEAARAQAAERLAVDVASQPEQRQLFHRSGSDPIALGYDPTGAPVVPYDRRGYAQIGPGVMFRRSPGEVGNGLHLIDAAGKVVVLANEAAAHVSPACEVVFSADAIDIYIRQFGSTYVQWRIRRLTHAARVADVWRIYGVFEAFRAATGDYTTGQELFNTGEVEMAIALQGKTELIGGTTHGGEMQNGFYVLLDGAAFDHTIPGVHECSRVELFQRCDMFEPGPSGGDNWPYDPPIQVGTNARRWLFDRDGLRLNTHVEWSKAGFGIVHSYFGMAPMRRANGAVQITDMAARAPLWEPVDVTDPGGPAVYTDASAVKVWGNRYALETAATGGWDRLTRNTYVRNDVAYNKVYFDFHGGEGATPGDTTEIGTTWDVENRINVTIKED